MKVSAIIAAAGSGSRMGSKLKKQYEMLNGLPVYIRSIELFMGLSGLAEIVLVVPSGDKKMVLEDLQKYSFHNNVTLVEGGRTRQQSVRRGLQGLKKASDIVCIHDAARPLASPKLLKTVIESANRYGACIPVLPLTDTVKVVDSQGYVELTPPRKQFYLVQTPQAFKTPVIISAHEKAAEAGCEATDDSALVEHYGGSVFTVPGEYSNVKITTPPDFNFALSYLNGMVEA